MVKNRWFGVTALVIGLATQPAAAGTIELIANGGFESGLASWVVTDQSGGSGSWFSQTGTLSPLNNSPVSAPPGGSFAAMTDQGGPGSHVLTQDFVVPIGVASGTLEFMLYIKSQAADFFSPASLNFAGVPNQQFRADVMTTAGDIFSVGAEVLLNAYQTDPGDPLESGYALVSVDVTALLQANEGDTLRLRFAEVDNQQYFAAGVDNVSLRVTVPEPGTLALLGLGLVAFAARRKLLS